MKAGGRPDRRSDNYYRDTKRRRSPSAHEFDDGWDRHRGDKKRSRYDEDGEIYKTLKWKLLACKWLYVSNSHSGLAAAAKRYRRVGH